MNRDYYDLELELHDELIHQDAALYVNGAAEAVSAPPARLGWQEIPLAREMNTLHLDFEFQSPDGTVLSDPAAVNVGNPHAIFFVDAAAKLPPYQRVHLRVLVDLAINLD